MEKQQFWKKFTTVYGNLAHAIVSGNNDPETRKQLYRLKAGFDFLREGGHVWPELLDEYESHLEGLIGHIKPSGPRLNEDVIRCKISQVKAKPV